MLSKQPYRVSGGRMALGIILAVALGVLTPVLILLEMAFLTPVVLLSGLFMVFLYCYAGRMPAWLYMTVQLGATAVVLNSTFMWMTMASGTFPGILAMRGIIIKRPFFEQLKTDVLFYLSGLVVAILIARISFGGFMISRMVDAVREQFKLMPDAFFLPFVETINRTLSTGAIPGMTSLTVSGYRAQLMALVDLVGETYERMLPGTLLTGAALSGVLTAMWGNWLMARHGLATDESYIGLTQWFLPRQATLGLLLVWVVAYIISETQYASGEAVYMAALSMATLAFMLQGICAIDRFLYRRNVSDRKRRILVGIIMVAGLALRLFNTFLFIVGTSSALFGSHGAIARRQARENEDDNDNH